MLQTGQYPRILQAVEWNFCFLSGNGRLILRSCFWLRLVESLFLSLARAACRRHKIFLGSELQVISKIGITNEVFDGGCKGSHQPHIRHQPRSPRG